MELKAKLKMILPLQQGVSQQGKQWQKCEALVTTTSGQYTKDVCLTFFGDKVNLLAQCQPGNTYMFSVDLQSRESKSSGRWFNDIICWKVEAVAQQQPQFAPQTAQFAPNAQQMVQAPTMMPQQPQMAPQYAAKMPQAPQSMVPQPQAQQPVAPQAAQPTTPAFPPHPQFPQAPPQYLIQNQPQQAPVIAGVQMQPRTDMFNDEPVLPF